MGETISIAIETSCRLGGVALGLGEKLIRREPLGPSGKHAAELLAAMDSLLGGEGIRPADVDELYVCVGPGSFTGLRVGITAARTAGQMLPRLRLFAVPAPLAVVENFAGADWQHMGVLLAAKGQLAHGTLLSRGAAGPEITAHGRVAEVGALLADWPRPLILTGEALEFLDVALCDNVELADKDSRMPTAEGVWRAGRRIASAGPGRAIPWNQLLPLYARRPEAVRLWEEKNHKS